MYMIAKRSNANLRLGRGTPSPANIFEAQSLNTAAQERSLALRPARSRFLAFAGLASVKALFASSLLFTSCSRLDAANIIYEENGVPVLENKLGCKLVPYQNSNSFGLGTFYFKNKPLGETLPYFIVEDGSQTAYAASEYTVLENTPTRGTVRFSGKRGKLEFAANVTLCAESFGFKIDYEFYPIHPIYHRLFINIPFNNSTKQFVKYPYETTLPASFNGRWTVEPDRSRVPFMFGREELEQQSRYVGVGYQLSDDFMHGVMEYDPQSFPGAPFKIFTTFKGMARPIDLQCVTRLELLHVDLKEEYKKVRKDFKIVVSISDNQYDCVKGCIDQNGYEPEVPFCRSIDDSLAMLWPVYKNAQNYFPGKGYTQILRFDNGCSDTTIPHGRYSKFILVGPQQELAYALYKYWETHPEESWARQRAVEMADFLVKRQLPNGAFSAYDTDIGKSSVIHPLNLEATSFKAYVFSMDDISVGALSLYKLYNEARGFEKADHPEWRRAALKAADYVVSHIEPDGELGRNYNEAGEYDIKTHGLCSSLMTLACLYKETGDERYKNARDRLEDWLYNRFLRVDEFANAGTDGGAWQGIQWPPPNNNDNMGVLGFASYFMFRYQDTGDPKYLQWAKDAVAYQWLTSVPVQMPGFKHITKGLQKEQDFYSAYDVPFRSKENIDYLPYLSKITGDPFFMKFYRMLIQTELHCQAADQPFPAYYIGLESDSTGREPIDKIAEEKVGYIVKFASTFSEVREQSFCLSVCWRRGLGRWPGL